MADHHRPGPPLAAGLKSPTILDVASRAGVSKSTVSNVVRGVVGVAEDTRRRVDSAIKVLGYLPNVLARHLVQQRTNILGGSGACAAGVTSAAGVVLSGFEACFLPSYAHATCAELISTPRTAITI